MRWNSSYYMVERVVELQQPICAALLELKRSELMPSDTELAAMSDYLFVVDPLVQITEGLGREKMGYNYNGTTFTTQTDQCSPDEFTY